MPSSYVQVQPPERRPDNDVFASGKLVPVIDLGGHDRAHIIRLFSLISLHVFLMHDMMDILVPHTCL